MNFDEKPRPSVGDTLRAALPIKWLRALQNLMSLPLLIVVFWRSKVTDFLHDSFGFSRDFADVAQIFVMVSCVAATIFLGWLTLPYYIDKQIKKRQAREYSRQQKVMAEHEKILERWQREVKPEGDSAGD